MKHCSRRDFMKIGGGVLAGCLLPTAGWSALLPVILLGAIGGLIVKGFVGLFIGAVILVFGYKLFEAWLVMEDKAAHSGTNEPTETA